MSLTMAGPDAPVVEHDCLFVPFPIGRDGGKVFYRNQCRRCGRWEHPNDPDVIAFDLGQVVQ